MQSMKFEKQLWDFLRKISDGMINAFRPIVEEYGLTLMQTRILMEVREGALHTVGSLGGIIGLTSGNASSMCKKLESAGYLKRIRSPEDERYVQLTITEYGQKILREIEEALEQRYGEFFASKREEEYLECIEAMAKVESFIREIIEYESTSQEK